MTNLNQAAQEYLDRQSRKTHPDGRFDNASRWYPSDEEKQDCCARVRSPSRAYPNSLNQHCRSLRHVAKLFSVPEAELRAAVKANNPPNREGGDDYYKVVALTPDGKMVSIFNGETEYQIGVEMQQAARQNHNGGYYVYSSHEVAHRATFPKDSKALDLPRVVIRVRAEGSYCRYDNGKLSFSRITPLEVIS